LNAAAARKDVQQEREKPLKGIANFAAAKTKMFAKQMTASCAL